MRIAVGAPVVLTPAAEALWHLPAAAKPWGNGSRSLAEAFEAGADAWPSLCGLDGPLYSYTGGLRGRRLCAVCRERGPLLEIHAGPGVVLTVEKQERSGAVELRNASSGKLLRQWSPKEARTR